MGPLIKRPPPSEGKGSKDNDLEHDPAERAAPGAARVADPPTLPDNGMCCHSPEAQTPPELSHVVSRWKNLPQHIRAAILALVQTTPASPAEGEANT